MERGPKFCQLRMLRIDFTRRMSAQEQMKTSTMDISPSKEDTFVISAEPVSSAARAPASTEAKNRARKVQRKKSRSKKARKGASRQACYCGKRRNSKG